MNKQLYALRIKLASMTDAKKILALKIKIQQIEKPKNENLSRLRISSREIH